MKDFLRTLRTALTTNLEVTLANAPGQTGWQHAPSAKSGFSGEVSVTPGIGQTKVLLHGKMFLDEGPVVLIDPTQRRMVGITRTLLGTLRITEMEVREPIPVTDVEAAATDMAVVMEGLSKSARLMEISCGLGEDLNIRSPRGFVTGVRHFRPRRDAEIKGVKKAKEKVVGTPLDH